MDKFVEKCNLPKLNPEKKENFNLPITSKEIELVAKKALNKKDLRTTEFHWPSI